MTEKTIILDINKNILKKEKYKRYTENSLLQVIIKESGKDVDLTNYTAKVYFELPDNSILNLPWDIVDNKVNINLISDLFLNKGNIYFEIILNNSIQKVTTFITCLEII